MYIDDEFMLNKYLSRLLQDGFDIEREEYIASFKKIFQTCKDSKLRNFQYKLNLGKIPTNSELNIWKLKDNDYCDYC